MNLIDTLLERRALELSDDVSAAQLTGFVAQYVAVAVDVDHHVVGDIDRERIQFIHLTDDTLGGLSMELFEMCDHRIDSRRRQGEGVAQFDGQSGFEERLAQLRFFTAFKELKQALQFHEVTPFAVCWRVRRGGC